MASKILLVTVFLLDLIAFSLAVAAEVRRSKASPASDGTINYCAYSSRVSSGLGVASYLFLLGSQVLIMTITKLLCCGKALQPGRSRVWAIVLFVTCWLCFIIAAVCLLAGSAVNRRHTKHTTPVAEDPPTCKTLRKGVFGAGAAFIVFTGISSELFYMSYSKAAAEYPPQSREAGIRMGSL